MSMSHKAFVFAFDDFEAELRSILELALSRNDPSVLRDFIVVHRESLVDPYEGNELEENWESLLEIRNVQEYGDFALTKYYDPLDDVGLGDRWEKVGDALEAHGINENVVLGRAVGRPDALFDPGRMGSYFQPLGAVRAHRQRLESVLQGLETPDRVYLDAARSMFEAAAVEDKGLYVTF